MGENKKKKLKRGTKVKVTFEGTVLNMCPSAGDVDGVRITVKPRPGKWSWWAVVPMTAVEEIE